VKLSGLGGNENMPRPKRYWNFGEVDKLVRLIAAMTCVENGIKWEQVDRETIWEGCDLAFPDDPRAIRRTKSSITRQSSDRDEMKMDGETIPIGPH